MGNVCFVFVSEMLQKGKDYQSLAVMKNLIAKTWLGTKHCSYVLYFYHIEMLYC